MTALSQRYGLLLAAVFWPAVAFAQPVHDSLTLTTGETLTGTLVNIDEGLVEFRTRHGSHTFLPIDQIHRGKVANPRELSFDDSPAQIGALSIIDGVLMLETGDEVSTMDAGQVTGARPVNTPTGQSGTTDFGLESGVLMREANRSRTELYARIELNRDTDWYSWRWYALSTLDGSDDFPRFLRSEFEWNRAPSSSITPFLLAGIERNRDQALDNRVYAAAGVERSWLGVMGGDIRAGLGVGATRERFDAADELKRRLEERRLFHDLSRTDTEIDLYLRIIYQAQLRDRLTFQDELRVMPSLTDAGDFRATYDSGLAWRLTDSLELNLRLRIEYDDDPPYSALDEWNAAVGAGVQMRFGTR
jgi:hypothetical protein